jgi:hypothetical protein
MTSITVVAADSTEALEEVQRRLGPEAMILSTRAHKGMVEVVATLAPSGPAARPDTPTDSSFALHLARHMAAASGQRGGILPPDLPARVVLSGPPGAGRSMLAARLAAEALRHSNAARPQLVAPRPDRLAPPGRLAGWARLMGLVPDRPLWPEGTVGALPAPHPDQTQIVDLSDLPAIAPQALAPLLAQPGSVLWLVVPSGLHPNLLGQLCAQHEGLARHLVLTRTDLFPPTADDLRIPALHGLDVALLAGGSGLLDALRPSNHRSPGADVRASSPIHEVSNAVA